MSTSRLDSIISYVEKAKTSSDLIKLIHYIPLTALQTFVKHHVHNSSNVLINQMYRDTLPMDHGETHADIQQQPISTKTLQSILIPSAPPLDDDDSKMNTQFESMNLRRNPDDIQFKISETVNLNPCTANTYVYNDQSYPAEYSSESDAENAYDEFPIVTISDLDQKEIEQNRKTIKHGKSKREKMLKANISRLLNQYKAGISADVFGQIWHNYFGYEIKKRHLPKCSSWNEFMLRCTWRKQIHYDGSSSYIYSKYKWQYPHIHALSRTGRHLYLPRNDVMAWIHELLDAFPIGIHHRCIAEAFQLFYGKRLNIAYNQENNHDGVQSAFQVFMEFENNGVQSGNIITYCGDIEVTDKHYMNSDQSHQHIHWMKTTLKLQLLQLFFHRSPSGILESELPKLYRRKFKCALWLYDVTLSQFISNNLNAYIESIETKQRKTLYYFRSYFGLSTLPHTITKLLKTIDIGVRCEWIGDKVSAILSTFGPMKYKQLVEATLIHGGFELRPWLLSTQSMSCIRLLMKVMPDLQVETDHNGIHFCSLKSMKQTRPQRDLCLDGYCDLVVKLGFNEGMSMEKIESKFNAKYDPLKLIVETPLIYDVIKLKCDKSTNVWKAIETDESKQKKVSAMVKGNIVCIMEFDEELNGTNAKLIAALEGDVWRVIITTGSKAGAIKAIPTQNLQLVGYTDI
eukprot:722304_1